MNEAKIRTRHLKYFSQLAEQAETALRDPDQAEWYSHVYDERDNIRAALEWANETDVETGLFISGRLYRFWQSFDQREGIHWLQRFLQKTRSRGYPQARASALHAYAWLLIWSQQFAEAQTKAEECLGIHRASGDRSGEIDGLTLLGNILLFRGDIEVGLDLVQQARVLSQSLGDLWREANAYFYLGWDRRDMEPSWEYWEKALFLYRKVGDQLSLANLLGVLGQHRVLNGDFELGEKYLDDALVLWQSNPRAVVWDNIKFAKSHIALERGDHEQAHSLLQEILLTAKESGNRMSYLWSLVRLGFVAVREGNLDEARINFTEVMPEFVKGTQDIGVVFALEGMAELYVALDKPETAARLIGWADMMRDKISDARPKLEQADVDKTIATCLAKLGEAAFADAYDEGKKMNLDEAVAYALRES
jgi:tetratricopeptide (TPR) repeat protein